MKKDTLLVLAMVAVAVLYVTVSWTAVMYFAGRKIDNTALIATVSVSIYTDPNLTIPLTFIDWGVLEPGDTATYTGYIVSESNVPIHLEMTTGDWVPANASQFINCTWNREGHVLEPDGRIAMTFTLEVSPDIFGIPSFEFVITVGELS